jgi:hypothetical protein
LLTLDIKKYFIYIVNSSQFFSNSYPEFYGNFIEEDELVITRTLYGALISDDLKLADFKWNGEKLVSKNAQRVI